jgi:uncharacterized membrane protein
LFAAWRVAVVLSARNLTGPAFATFISQANAAEHSTQKLQRSISQLRTTAAVGFTMAGAALGGFVAQGLHEAGKFELAMKNVQIATGASASQMRLLQRQAISLSGATSQDVTQIGREQAVAASSGLTTKQVLDMMPQIAAYADVQMRAHGQDPVKAVKEAIQEAHLLRAYGSKQESFRGNKVTDLQAMLEYMNQISFAQPEEQGKIITQSGYFAVQARQLGMSIQQIMDVIATMGQTGLLKGKGGTGMAQLINGVINTVALTGHRQRAKTEALRGLGVIDANGKPMYVDDKGHIIFTKMLDHLIKVSDHTKPNVFQQMLKAAFGENGGRFAAVIANRDTREQMVKTRTKMAHIPTIHDAQEGYLNQFLVSLNTLRTNITTAMASLFLPLAQRLTPYVRRIAAEVMRFAQYMFDHPDLGLKVSVGIIGGAVGALGTGVAMAAGQVWALVRAVNTLAAAAGRAAIAEDAEAASKAGLLVPGGAGRGAANVAKVGVMERVGKWVLGIFNFYTLGLAGAVLTAGKWLIEGGPFKLLSEGFFKLALKAEGLGGMFARIAPALLRAATFLERFAGVARLGVLSLAPFLMSGKTDRNEPLMKAMEAWGKAHGYKAYDQSDPWINHLQRENMRKNGRDPGFYGWDWTGGKSIKQLVAEHAKRHAPIVNIYSDGYNKEMLATFQRALNIPNLHSPVSAASVVTPNLMAPGMNRGPQPNQPVSNTQQVTIQNVNIRVTGEQKDPKLIAREVAGHLTGKAAFYTRAAGAGTNPLDPYGIFQPVAR